MIRLAHIVVATDFSEPSRAALDYGRELARAFNANLSVLHVAENLLTTMMTPDGSLASTLPDLQHDVEESARERVTALLSAKDHQELGAKAVTLTSSAPAFAIVEYARKAGVDLIVMGTHGRSGLGHLLMGSVAERVVRMAPCPVLTVRHPEHEFVVPDPLMAVARSS